MPLLFANVMRASWQERASFGEQILLLSSTTFVWDKENEDFNFKGNKSDDRKYELYHFMTNSIHMRVLHNSWYTLWLQVEKRNINTFSSIKKLKRVLFFEMLG